MNETVRHIYTRVDLQGLMAASEGKIPLEIELMKVGSYKSFAYNEFEVMDADLAGFVESFERGVRAKGENGEDKSLPVNFRHDMYGEAAGWITGLRTADGALLATVEWTDIGEAALKNKRYKFISPEWYFAYEDETTGKMYRNVLAGAGLTNVPLFQKLKPLTSAEGRVILLDNDMTDASKPATPKVETPTPAPAEPKQEEKQVETPKPVAEPQKAAEGQDGRVVMTAAEHQAMMTRMNSLEGTVRRTKIEKEVELKVATATKPGKLFPAQRDAAVELLVAAEAAGEEVVTKVRAFMEALPDQRIASEMGSDENSLLTAAEKINKLTEDYKKAHEGANDLTALNAIKKTNPELFTNYTNE